MGHQYPLIHTKKPIEKNRRER
uniref:Plasma membrane aquaporin n=1 Tax=Rhizophora mucronata TaxID=61149 RepID=A0A2P2QCU2_RHIMU